MIEFKSHELFSIHSYSLITPNVLRVESEEKVVVEANGLNAATEVTITVHDFPFKRQVLYLIKANLNPDEGMLTTATIKVGTASVHWMTGMVSGQRCYKCCIFLHAICIQRRHALFWECRVWMNSNIRA